MTRLLLCFAPTCFARVHNTDTATGDRAMLHLAAALEWYQLDGFVTEHCNLLLDRAARALAAAPL